MKNTTTSTTTDLESYVSKFAQAWAEGEHSIHHSAILFHKAVETFGWEPAFKRFNERFGQIGKYNFTLLNAIGSGTCDVRVWFLPNYMHGIRMMQIEDQVGLLNNKRLVVYKFASEKIKTIDIGSINQSDWRVAFDREKVAIRTGKEQLAYIHAKKREFATRKPYHVSKGKAVFESACTLTRDQLQELLDLMK